LKFETTQLPDRQVRIVVEVDNDKLNIARRDAVRQLSSRNKIPGFRPGKAPADVVRRMYGEETIEHHAIEILIDDVYPQIIKEAGIQPSGTGKLDEIISQDPAKFAFIVPLEPSVDLGKYKTIRLPYELPNIEEVEIDKIIDRIQLDASTTEDSKTAADNGDFVSVKIDAILLKPEKEEDPQILKNTPAQVIIGNDDESFPYFGFSKELVGLSAGQHKQFTYKYKKDSNYEKLKGKEVSFDVTIESVKKIIKPEINKEFAKTVGFDDLATLRVSIQNQLLETKTREYDNKYFSSLIDKIIAQARIEYPPHLLQEEIESVQHSFEHDLTHQNLDLETYLKINQLEKEKFIEDEIKPAAKRRLEQSLVVEEVSRQEKIELEKEELQKVYSQTVMEMQAEGELQRLQRKVSPKRLSNAMVMQAASKLMNKRVLQTLKDIATGNYQDVTEPTQVSKPAKTKKAVKNEK